MKRIISIVLCLVMVCMLCSCGEKEAGTQSGEVNLKIYQLGTKPDDWAEVEAAFNKLAKEDIGVTTTWEFIPSGSFSEKMNVIMAASEEFDICFTGFANTIASAVRNGGFMALDELIESECPELKDTMPSYWWDAATINGKIYAVPNQQVAAMPNGVWIYKRLADKYNIDMNEVKCLADIEPILEILKKNEPGLYPFRAHPGQHATILDGTEDEYEKVTNVLYFRKDDPKVQLINYYELPQYYEAIKTLNEWWKKGYIRKDIVSVLDDNNDFKAKKYGLDTGSWKPGVEVEAIKNQGEEIVYATYNDTLVNTSNCDSTMFAISRTCKNPEKAIQFLNYINTDVEAYNLLASGIEGKHYEKLEDGRIRIKEGNTYPIGAGWKWGNQFNAYVTDTQDPDVWEQTKKLNEDAEVSPLMGFRVDRTNIATEMAQISGVLSEYSAIQYDDYEKLYPEFLKRLEEAGLPKVQAEYQKQIDEFLKNKNK